MTSTEFVSWNGLRVPPEVEAVLTRSPEVLIPDSREQLLGLSLGHPDADRFEVAYQIPGRGRVVEAEVVRCRNGVGVNYPDPYMRRRDPDSLVVTDDGPTDKPRFHERFEGSFEEWRAQMFDWLGQQSLIALPFMAGGTSYGYHALLIAPRNAAFFAVSVADLQTMIPRAKVPADFLPRATVYLVPTFRLSHCQGRQVVLHNRSLNLHEIYSTNLYPGPSAKKGIYGVLLNIGRQEGWITAHGSTVRVVTPYDMMVTIMHEGASGGGKSEMLEYAHRQPDGRLLMGENLVTGEKRLISLPRGCELCPVTDDMALCHTKIQNDSGKLVVTDAEAAWFLRINHISVYGADPQLERLTAKPAEPLVFLNLYAVPNATCLIWEHTEDKPGKPCSNPRVIVPRRLVPNVVTEPVEVDVRSFGVRMPPCTSQRPTYGIAGMLHVLPPALAWIWRLVAPRGYDNPSITESDALSSEGVGSYWPFATGRRVDHANLILRQILDTPKTRYTLCPNQHVGAWKVGFMAQWISREYLARRGGANFRPDLLVPARCSLFGYALRQMLVEGTPISQWFLQVESQPEVGKEAYDRGAAIMHEFFSRELKPYLEETDLDPLGRRIIECCLQSGAVDDYLRLIPQ